MEGRCPGCNRAYDISEEFLSMGGKAKCPHCLLELEFDGPGSSSSGDRARDVTRADDRQHRMSYDADEGYQAEEPDEVDSHCPACERRYKVDRKYLELGGAAQCPHCGVDLIFESDVAPAQEPQDYTEEPEGAEDWGQSGEISLPELDELRVPTTVEEPPVAQPPAEEPPMEEPAAEDLAEEPEAPEEDEMEDEDLADELPTQMTDGQASVELEDDQEEPEGMEPAEEEPPSAYEKPSVGLAEELFGDSVGEEEAGQEETPEPESDGPVVLEEQPRTSEPFGALASNEDWASAAARWAESGFKADEMPSFIKGDEQEEGLEEPDTRPTEAEPPVGGELLIAEAAADSIEVSDADIMLLEESEADILPEPAPGGAGSSWAEAASREVEAKRTKKAPMAKAKRVAEGPSLFSKLKSPWVLAGVLVGVVALTVVLLWVFMGGGEDVAGYQFPSKNLKANVVKAPDPSAYKAKDEAIEHYGLGNRLAYQGKFEDAILEYKQALRLDPGYPHPHRALGSVYAALGKPKLSAASYQTYLRLSPHSADSAQVRGIIKSSGGK